ncbi:MAG: SBBP repeat-containing protein, partial [Thermodesulfovibrionales bacterium]
MRRNKTLSIGLWAVMVALVWAGTFAMAWAGTGETISEEKKKEVSKSLRNLSIPFVENKGQYDEKVSYAAKTFGGTLFVTKDGGLVYSLPKVEKEKKGNAEKAGVIHESPRVEGGVVIRERLIGAEVKGIEGVDQAETKVSYFRGSDTKNWQSGVTTYNKVSLGEAYKGINVELKAGGSNVEKLFYVSPGADPSEIKIGAEGAEGIRLNDAGELVLETALGEVRFTRPVAYQVIDGRRIEVEAGYRVERKEGKLVYAFDVGDYDRTKELVIDPLLASTFLGGSDYDYAYSIALDSTGNVYVSGITYSSDFPTTSGAYDTSYNGGDVFVSKLDSDLTQLLASTFLGGSSDDYAFAIALDSTGNVYVTGMTGSSNFPTTSGAYDESHNGNWDVFVSKLSSDLTTLSASTFLGGSSDESGYSIALDSTGNVYVTGMTGSSNFPTTSGAYDTSHNGSNDVFVSKLDKDLTQLLASTFLGGSSDESGYSIALDSTGNVYVSGNTYSSDFPTTSGAYDTSHNGGSDVFVSKLTAYTLTVTKAGTGTGTVTSDPAGINCGADCTEPYDYNTVVTLTAQADSGSTFAGWSGDCTDIGNNQAQVTMDANKSCTATFNLFNLSGPDLTGEWISMTSYQYRYFTWLRGTLRVRNIGNQPTSGRFMISFYLSDDGISLGNLMKSTYVWVPISAGSYRDVRFYYPRRT